MTMDTHIQPNQSHVCIFITCSLLNSTLYSFETCIPIKMYSLNCIFVSIFNLIILVCIDFIIVFLNYSVKLYLTSPQDNHIHSITRSRPHDGINPEGSKCQGCAHSAVCRTPMGVSAMTVDIQLIGLKEWF